MKRFKDFKIDPILITHMPVHGSHAVKKSKKPITITATPVHGAHAIKESIELDSWKNRNDNNHLGKYDEDVAQKLDHDHETWGNHPHTKRVRKYTNSSREMNQELIHRAVHKKPSQEYSIKATMGVPHYQPSKHDIGSMWAIKDKLSNKKHHNDKRALFKAHVKQLDHAIHHKPVEHDIHVYHGTSQFNPDDLAKQHPDRLIKSPAYMSTSISKHRALGFAGGQYDDGPHSAKNAHVLHIHVQKGQKGLFVGQHSEFPEEHEMILPRNTTLKVHKTPTKLSNGAHVWHAHIVEQPK